MHKGNRSNLTATCLTALSVLALSAFSVMTGYPGAPDLHPKLTQRMKAIADGRPQAPTRGHKGKGLSLIGFTDLGRPANGAFSSDVWAHRDYAYVGTFFDTTGATTGIQVIDISDPTNPTLVNNLPVPVPYTGTNDVKVAAIKTKHFKGDLLVTSNAANESPSGGDRGVNGIQIWDVTDPLNAIELSRIPGVPVHNLFLYQRGKRAFVALAVPFAEVFSPLFPPFVTIGDFILVEVTDPRDPQIVSDWGAGKDGGFSYGAPFPIGGIPPTCDPSVCRGSSPFVNLHDVWVNEKGTIAYLAYWDLGLVLLDISKPSKPKFIGLGSEPPALGSDEGNAHAAVPTKDGKHVLVTDEDFEPGPWGFLRIFDTRKPKHPKQIATYATDGTLNDPSMTRTIHNIIVKGKHAYISWYFEGIHVLDISNPKKPKEVASFLPPTGTGAGNFWGIYVHDNLILASDIESGLYILELTRKKKLSGPLVSGDRTAEAPTVLSLEQNQPNPFNPMTVIRFSVGEQARVRLTVYDVSGKAVRTLLDQSFPAGTHSVQWNGRDDNGAPVSSGVYFYKLTAGRETITRKAVFLK